MEKMKIAVAVVMASTGLDPVEASKRLNAALDSLEKDESPEYKAFRKAGGP